MQEDGIQSKAGVDHAMTQDELHATRPSAEIQVEIEVESDDEGLRGGKRGRTMYQETGHETWPLSFRVPRPVAMALRERYECLWDEAVKKSDEGEAAVVPRNFSIWLRDQFRALWPDLPWDEPTVVVDDLEGE